MINGVPSRGMAWLGVVRHGESVGNVILRTAQDAGERTYALPYRDADTPLTALGEAQADALGTWLAGLPVPRRPDRVLSSPYLRARQTVGHALTRAGLDLPVHLDERLRDREVGVLEGLTTAGIAESLPAEAERKRRLGRFYYRPPGGESWADVALRLRAVLREADTDRAGQRVLVVAHDVVVLLLRYLVDGLDEARLLGIAERQVPHCSITSWRAGPLGPVPEAVYDTAHLGPDPTVHIGQSRRSGDPPA